MIKELVFFNARNRTKSVIKLGILGLDAVRGMCQTLEHCEGRLPEGTKR